MQAKDVNIQDDLLRHFLDLMKFGNGVNRDVVTELNAMQRDIVKLLDQGTMTEWRASRLNSVLDDIDSTVARYYAGIENSVTGSVAAIPPVSSNVAVGAISDALQGSMFVGLPSDSILDRLATNTMIQGAPQAAWWAKQSTDRAFRFQSVVRRGVSTGLANPHIIKAVKDEIGVSKRHAETLVRTSILTVSNESLLATYKANDSVIKGVEWVATLDSRTCLHCAPRDGLTWTLDRRGVGHKVSYRTPPLHFSCRCLLSPITKTFKELGLPYDEPPPINRSSVGGPVGGNMDFEAFLKRQGKEFQKEVLGTRRLKMWRNDDITLLDLINNQDRVLTIDAIKKKL